MSQEISLKNIRTMNGGKIPTIDLSNVKWNGDKDFKEFSHKMYEVLKRDFEEFAELYRVRAAKDRFFIEDVFDACVILDFKTVVKTAGIDIVYNDAVIHIRIVFDDIEEQTPHTSVINSRDFTTVWNDKTVIVHLSKFVDEGSAAVYTEHWEYYVAV